MAYPPFLEVDRDPFAVLAVGFGDHDVGFVTIVGDGQEPHPGDPAPAQGGRDVGQPVPGVEHLGPDEVGREIAIAESEPIRVGPVGGEFLFRAPGFVAPTPPAFGIDPAPEGVHTGVEVGADADAVHPGVVADVDHRGDPVRPLGVGIVGRGKCRRPEQLAHSEQ